MPPLLIDDPATLLRTLLIGVLAYASLVLLLRVSGKRTLSKMNAFDFVVTVALGSTLATILLNRDITLAEGVVALGLLIALQFAITWSSVRIRWVRRTVTGEPTLLVHRGRLLPAALRRTRVTESEIRAALRAEGLAGVEQARAVVFETDGSFSVVPSASEGRSALDDVRGLAEAERQSDED